MEITRETIERMRRGRLSVKGGSDGVQSFESFGRVLIEQALEQASKQLEDRPVPSLELRGATTLRGMKEARYCIEVCVTVNDDVVCVEICVGSD